MNKLNILFLTSWYPNKKAPTLGNFVQRHAEAVSNQHNVFVLFTTSLPNLKQDFLIESKEHKNLTEVIVYYKKPITKIEKALWVFKALHVGFNKITKSNNIDLVHLNVIRPLGFFALYLKKFKKLKYIITEHWTGFLPENNFFEKLSFFEKQLIKSVAKSAEKICPVSENLGQKMELKGLSNLYFPIPNVVDFDLFHANEKRGNYFLHVSHLKQEHKNIFGILEAFATFSEGKKDVFLKIVGDENLEHAKNKAKILGIESKIDLIGKQSSKEIALLMQSCLAFILFSNYENLPCVLEEAQACGARIISTKVGGIAEHFPHDNENVFLLNAKDVKALESGLHHFYKTEDSFQQKENRSKIAQEKFSTIAVANQYNTIYQSVV